MAKAQERSFSNRYGIRSTSKNVYGLQRLNFSVKNSLKPNNRLPDYICSRVEEDVWKVTYTSDNRDDKLIQISQEHQSTEEIASKIDNAYQSLID